MIYRLVLENLKHRPVRTLLSAIAIGVQVTMILTLVGVSRGMLGDISARSRGTGADLVVRPPNSAILGFSGNMPEKIVEVVRKTPHVVLATATLVHPVGNLNSITGIHREEFDAMSGGFRYLEGGPFMGPDDVILDEVQAKTEKVHVGGFINLGKQWRVAGIVDQGKLARVITDIHTLQDVYGETGKATAIWAKVDDPANTKATIDLLKQEGLDDYSILSIAELTSLTSPNNIPLLKQFTYVVIGIAVIVGFLVVFLSMYTAVLERTREIGILKALGASPGYIVGILLRETVLLAIAGTIVGILMTYGTRWVMQTFVPTMTQVIVPDWWPYGAMIAIVGALIGALYPGMKAARQDAIEALSYD